MCYAGWLVSYYDMEAKETFYKGTFCTIDLAQECATNLKKHHSCVKIFHLVYDNQIQIKES